MSNNGKKPPVFEDGFEIEIERIVPDDMRSTFVNHIVVQNAGFGEFHISFFEIKHPILIDEAAKEKLKESGKVKAECVARIVVSGERMPTFIAALARVYGQSQTGSDEDQNQDEKDKKHAG